MELLVLASFILHSILQHLLYCTFNISINITVTCLSKISKITLLPYICCLLFLTNNTLFKYHRILQFGRDPKWSPCATSCSKQSQHFEALDFVQLDLENVQRQKCDKPSGQPVPMPNCSHFLTLNCNLPCSKLCCLLFLCSAPE